MSRWYGSMTNRCMEMAVSPAPQVGMGATELWYSDRTPYEIIEVIDDRHIRVRELGWRRVDDNGMSDCQHYEYFPDESKPTTTLYLTKQGQWRERIGRNGLGDNRFLIGFAERYYDFSF